MCKAVEVSMQNDCQHVDRHPSAQTREEASSFNHASTRGQLNRLHYCIAGGACGRAAVLSRSGHIFACDGVLTWPLCSWALGPSPSSVTKIIRKLLLKAS